MATRLGLIGRGKWGRKIERTLLSLPDVSVGIIRKEEPLRSDIDGILIASPSASHADLALPYISAGIATFIEKPMATSVRDAQRIQDAVTQSRTPVFVGHIHLYNPVYLALLKVLPGLGAIRYALCENANGNPRTDSSVLWDWLPHDLSRARAIFGDDPVDVQAWNLTDSQISQAAVSRYRYGTASLVSTMSWLSPIRRQRMTIAGERGLLIFDEMSERKLILHDKQGILSYPPYDGDLPLTRELRAFLNVVRSGTVDRSHVTLGVFIAEAIAAAEYSIAKGGAAVEIRI
jgi:predicted dehydrogenase